MGTDEGRISGASDNCSELPKSHRCPFLVQYLLISPLRRLLEPAEKILKPFVQPGMKVLEPGCGFGYFSLPLAQLVGSEGRVVCVDVEPRAITRLQRRAHKAGLADRIEVHACEPRDLGLADSEGRFDLVTVIHVLHEFDDVPGFLAQAVRMLKPDGRMLVVEPKGHVKPEQFEAEMKFCRAAGLRQLDLPEGKRRNPTALLALKSEG